VRHTIHRPYNFPSPQELLAFAKSGVEELTAGLTARQRQRISGLGIAAPFELWNWAEEVGAPVDVLKAWKDFDLAQEIASVFDWPVHFCNDASAACAAELLFGHGQTYRDYAYFYLGYFIGGGIVLNGSLYLGSRGNAGALASFPVAASTGRPEQLVHAASFTTLERDIRASGGDPEILWSSPDDWRTVATPLDQWMKRAAPAIAAAAAGITAVLDCPAIIIDGAMPRDVRSALVGAVREALAGIDTQGIFPFELVEGSIGIDARAMGAASLPLFDNFIIDRNLLFKEQA
jgi:predicted NBD/HSP70 family sugar kinase